MEEKEGCKTRYPLYLIHGTGFRDFKHIGYWGRIPGALEARGATIFYGRQDSWATVEENAATLKTNLLAFLERTEAKKVNIIAHSKGGLEARYLASVLGCAPYIASITTIATPHNGSKTMDRLMRLPKTLLRFAGFFVNLWFRILGDRKPDFFHTCHQFTSQYAEYFNTSVPDIPGILYQSVATVMQGPRSDALLCLPNAVVGRWEGENDGLVTPEAALRWDKRQVWRSGCRRGISHADSVDIRRRPFGKGGGREAVSDIVEAYLRLVAGLKDNGC